MFAMDRIARLVDEALAAGLGSAAAVSVGDRGREVFRHTAGTVRRLPDRGAAIDEHTPFDLASVTKPMATVAIAMVLVAEGRLDLEAPVRQYLPEAATTATVRQLLGHTAGCSAHVEFFRRLRVESHSDPYAVLVRRAQREACGPAGVAPVYSDLGFIQLGAALEQAGGARLDAMFAELVAGPLSLAARYAPAPTSPIAGAVATELDERGLVCGLVHDENCFYGGGIAGHAGLFGSIDDVARFAAAIVETAAGTPRGRFVPAIVNRFFTDVPTPLDVEARLGLAVVDAGCLAGR